jgi:hypothetical protein
VTNQKPFAKLPPTLSGKPWSVTTLKGLDPETMRKILRLYGASAINAALQRNRSNK